MPYKANANLNAQVIYEQFLTVKVGVHLEKDQTRDFRITAYEAMRNITKPTFRHEINTVLQVKDKKSGSLGGNMELVWDKDLHDYMLREIDNGQLNLFDRNEENDVGAGSGDPALPADDNGIIGTDYEVVSDSPAEEWEKDVPEPKDGSDGHHADPKVLFEYMKQFIGAEMKVLESMGQYTVSTLDNKVVLSSACQPTDRFYCSAEKLAPHVGHAIICVGSPSDEEEFKSISIWCDDCEELLFQIDAAVDAPAETGEYPEDEDSDGYEYDPPEGSKDSEDNRGTEDAED